MSEPVPQRSCMQCGAPINARYCGQCGHDSAASAAAADGDGWLGALSDVRAEPSRRLSARMVFDIARHPGPVGARLALDRNFNGHWAFFLAGVAAHLLAFQWLLPHVLTRFGLQTAATASADLLVQKVLILATVLIVAPVFYYLCRLLSGEARRPRAYAKLVLLGFGYWYFLSIALFLVWIALCFGISLAATSINPQDPLAIAAPVERGLGFIMYVTSIVFGVATMNRSFWALKWPAAIGVGLGYLLLSHLVLFPIFERAMETLKVHAYLRGLGL